MLIPISLKSQLIAILLFNSDFAHLWDCSINPFAISCVIGLVSKIMYYRIGFL